MSPSLFREIQALEAFVLSQDPCEGLTPALEETVATVIRRTGADRVTLIQFDWETRRVHHFLRGGPGWAEVMTAIGFDELSAGLSGWVLRTGEVALSPKEPPDPRESPEVRQRRKDTQCGAVMVAPIGGLKDRLGTLTAIRRPEQPDFGSEDAEALGTFAQTAAWIIRLFQERNRTARAQAEATTAIRSKTSFLSNLSHELRTPLNGVLGFSHLLDATELDPNQKIMVQTILASGQRLLATIDNLLELAQFETGQFHLEKAPYSPRAVLDSVVAKYHEQLVEKNLHWQVGSDHHLPVVLEGDAVRIGQAWNHILSNAVKFTDQGTITVYLEVVKTEGRAQLMLSVSDTGIGLPTEKSGQWFSPFHQEDGSLTRRFGGTGLGLALCDRIVRKMGGGLTIRGEPGVGTSVKVWIDIGPDRNGSRISLDALKILIQDQDPVHGQDAVRRLERTGHRVDYVSNLDQARERLGSVFYEVILVKAPTPSSFELRTLGEVSINKDLVLVGFYDQEGFPEADETPWSATLVKPLTPDALEEALKRSTLQESP